MRKLAAIIFASVLLGGCKAEVEAPLMFSEIAAGVTKMTWGDLYVEISACGDHEDSRKPSAALLEAKSKVPGTFEGAQYVDCFSKKLDTFAQFRLPVSIDGNNDGKLESSTAITLLNEKGAVYVAVPPALAARIEAARQDPDGTGPTELSISLKLDNDTRSGVVFQALAAYVDGQPRVHTTLCAHPNDPFVVKVSNVTVDEAMTNGRALVIVVDNKRACP